MKKLLIALFSALVLAGCSSKDEITPSYKIDPVATANAPWKVGELVWEYLIGENASFFSHDRRYFVGVSTNGDYLIRGDVHFEYDKDSWSQIDSAYKALMGDERVYDVRIEPHRVINVDSVTLDAPIIDGNYLGFYTTGEKYGECYYERGSTPNEPCTFWYRSGEIMVTIWYLEGKKHRMVRWLRNGQKSMEGEYGADGSLVQLRRWDEDGNFLSEVNYSTQ